jgi:hypothetical protein
LGNPFAGEEPSRPKRNERHPSKIDEDGRRHYPIRAIPYQDPEMEAARLKAVHEARVKIVPRV